jgi:hypothetical protein
MLTLDVSPSIVNPSPGTVLMAAPESATLHDMRRAVVREHKAVVACVTNSVEHAITAGQALLRIKIKIGHGDWTAWKLEFCRTEKISDRTLCLYVQLAKATNNGDLDIRNAVANLGFREALALIKKPRASKASVTTTTVTTTSVKTALGRDMTSVKTALARDVTVLNDLDRVETAWFGFVAILNEVEPLARQRFLKDFRETQPWRGATW